MILLENKITIFNQMVFVKKQEECRKKLEEEKELYNRKIMEKERTLKAEKEEIINRRASLASKNGYELLSKAHEENRIAELRQGEKLLDSLLEKVKLKLKDYTQTDNYARFVLSTLDKALEDVKEENIIVYMRKKDSHILKERVIEKLKAHKIKAEFRELYDKHIGGLIISDENETYEINLTLLQRIEDSRYKIGSMLHFGVKEVDNWIKDILNP